MGELRYGMVGLKAGGGGVLTGCLFYQLHSPQPLVEASGPTCVAVVLATAKPGLALIDMSQVGPAQIGLDQECPAQVGPAQFGPAQVGPTQFGPAQVGVLQVSRKMVLKEVFQSAPAQVGLGRVVLFIEGNGGRLVRAPYVRVPLGLVRLQDDPGSGPPAGVWPAWHPQPSRPNPYSQCTQRGFLLSRTFIALLLAVIYGYLSLIL